MKKKLAHIAITLLLICAILGGCSLDSSSEKAGVPDSVVMDTNVYDDFFCTFGVTDYDIQHNVDTAAHTDTVTLVLNGGTEYTSVTSTSTLKFQYTKSDDIWTLIDEGATNIETDLNPEGFINNSPWQGSTPSSVPSHNRFNYTIYVDDMDTSNCTITLRYEIDFHDEDKIDIPLTEQRTVRYQYMFDGCYQAYIDVTGSGYVFNAIDIWLNSNGLSWNYK